MKPSIIKNNIAIKLVGVSKKYEIHHEKPTLVEKFFKGNPPAGGETFWALNKIDLTVYKKERVGIIGSNGSGKTTLLKIIAGITTPTNGAVKTYGKIVSLIDLEAGFHPDLTGLQNMYLNGFLLGLSKKEIDQQLNNIIRFADIGRFIDAPLFTYSAGMTLRLGFAIAVHANPDILILDEGMAVGDEIFRQKSEKKIKEFFRMGKTILVVSHWLEFIEKNCDRIIILHKGNLIVQNKKRALSYYRQIT
jgi:ABC-type polysaccharide/polyol phosphate transport system ATPase subunit